MVEDQETVVEPPCATVVAAAVIVTVGPFDGPGVGVGGAGVGGAGVGGVVGFCDGELFACGDAGLADEDPQPEIMANVASNNETVTTLTAAFRGQCIRFTMIERFG